MIRRTFPYVLSVVLAGHTIAAAQDYRPVVSMSVTEPNGTTHQLSTAESRLARLTTEDGTEYGFRPTIQDSKPWNDVVVTIFKTATAEAPDEELGRIRLRTGGAALYSDTTPSFQVAVLEVLPPAAD